VTELHLIQKEARNPEERKQQCIEQRNNYIREDAALRMRYIDQVSTYNRSKLLSHIKFLKNQLREAASSPMDNPGELEVVEARANVVFDLLKISFDALETVQD